MNNPPTAEAVSKLESDASEPAGVNHPSQPEREGELINPFSWANVDAKKKPRNSPYLSGWEGWFTPAGSLASDSSFDTVSAVGGIPGFSHRLGSAWFRLSGTRSLSTSRTRSLPLPVL